MKLIDLTGQRFSRLLVVSRAANDNHGKPRWNCVCDCGGEKTVAASDLKKKGRGTKSCGCLAKEATALAKRTHGMSRHPAYAVWRSLLARCNRPSHYAFANYGGRGITVCDEWKQSFDAFWSDMGPSYTPGLTLDRIDNDQGYFPGNCRWVGYREQAQNRRAARKVLYKGALVNVSEAARLSGINSTTILYRLAAGWENDRLFDAPDFKNRK